jgi:hypothetical protein
MTPRNIAMFNLAAPAMRRCDFSRIKLLDALQSWAQRAKLHDTTLRGCREVLHHHTSVTLSSPHVFSVMLITFKLEPALRAVHAGSPPRGTRS